jgi:DsbC/DsbD-like thiol-disulfide interchange protein
METKLIAAHCHQHEAAGRSRRIQWPGGAAILKPHAMPRSTLRPNSLLAQAGAVLVLAGAIASSARAEDASPWDGGTRSALRLIAGTPTTETGKKVLRGGIEIRLDPGWRTYWRYPGDSGVPPRFRFTRSENLASVRVLWPAPQRFAAADDTSIGYTGDIIFPLRIVARDPKRPVLLRLDADYAICQNLCVPADGRAELVLNGDPSSRDEALSESEKRVPKEIAIGEGEGLSIAAVAREGEADKPRVLVDVRAPEGTKPDLFAEGPSADWALPVPEPIPGAPGGLQRFAFALDGIPPGAAEEGAQLRLTAVAGDQAIEVVTQLGDK